MLAAALVVSDSLGRGFDRAARASDLPDVIVRFNGQPAGSVAARVRALPDLAAFSLRQEFTGAELSANGHDANNGAVEVVDAGRRGYAIVAGRDVSGAPGEVVVERGLAAAWGVRLGDTMQIGELPPQRVVGFSESPDNVSYPLASPRVYLARRALRGLSENVNMAQIWLRDPANLDEVLVQARASSYGLHDVRFITRTGVRVLLDQAAGIVIDLLVALSVIALATAAVMLGASARAEVQRRLRAIGIRRAVGATRLHLALTQGLEALLVAAPAATIGAAAGTLATYGPTGRLLMLLNEPPLGSALALPLLAGWLGSVAIPVLAAAVPAWWAAGRPPVALLAGAELRAGGAAGRRRSGGWGRLGSGRWSRPGPRMWGRPGPRGRGRPGPGGRSPGRAGLTTLGARLVAARRGRLVLTASALGASTAFVLLMLALASALSALETDPGALGKRYQLVAQLPADQAGRVRTLPGVQTAAPRYEDEGVDSFSLQEPIHLIAYPGDHTAFEAPPLTAGRRLRGQRQAEVGSGLASALGLAPGSSLVVQLGSGGELRLRVSGIVSSLDHDGLVAYVPARALLALDPSASEELAVIVRPGADVAAVNGELGTSAAPASGATARGVPLVSVLRSLLRAVAIVDGLVCLYALIQACALTVQERRRTISVLRAVGAGGAAVRRLLTGAVAAIVVPAALVGIMLERLVLGPLLSNLAAGYANLPLAASGTEIAAVLGGLLVAGAAAILWVARRTDRQPVLAGLEAT